MKILITGANGFIGSYLANYFIEKGETVFATARQFHPSTTTLLKSAHCFELDVMNKQVLEELEIEADVIIHTATANDIISRNPSDGLALSGIGTRNILDFAVKNKIPKCIIFSTLQVYGTELSGTIDEQSPLLYQNDYGLNHIVAEMYGEMYSRNGKVACVSVRPSNVYGNILTEAFNRWSLVPGCFCKEAAESGSITIKSSGKQLRNFVNLENISRAIGCILQNFPGSYECYNLASSKANTMVEVAQMVKEVCEKKYGSTIAVHITGTVPAETNYFDISLEKLKKAGFTEDERFTLETAINNLFDFIKTTK